MWIGHFNLMKRARPASFGGIAPINPMDILTMAEKLDWPCSYDEAIHVITSMDDSFRDRHQKQ